MHVCIHVYRHVDMYLRAGQEGNMTPARIVKSRSMDTQSNRHVRGNVYGMHVDRCLIMHIGICLCACVQMRLSATTEDARAEALRRRDKKDTGNERQADIYWRDWTETMAEVHMCVPPYMHGDACRHVCVHSHILIRKTVCWCMCVNRHACLSPCKTDRCV